LEDIFLYLDKGVLSYWESIEKNFIKVNKVKVKQLPDDFLYFLGSPLQTRYLNMRRRLKEILLQENLPLFPKPGLVKGYEEEYYCFSNNYKTFLKIGNKKILLYVDALLTIGISIKSWYGRPSLGFSKSTAARRLTFGMDPYDFFCNQIKFKIILRKLYPSLTRKAKPLFRMGKSKLIKGKLKHVKGNKVSLKFKRTRRK